MNPNKIRNHIDSLRSRHSIIDHDIILLSNGFSDDLTITELKKEKLKIKEEIEYYELKLQKF